MVAVEVVCSANVFSKALACVFDLVATEACVERGQRFPKTTAGNFTSLLYLPSLVDKIKLLFGDVMIKDKNVSLLGESYELFGTYV